MRVLVTGGAGFIGSHVVDAVVAAGHDVVAVDRAESPNANPGAVHLIADVTDVGAMRRLVAGVDAVSHQAAMVGLGVDFADVRDYVTDNDLGTGTLLLALHETGFGGRLVLASSMVVYGEGCYDCAEHGWVRPGPRDPADLDGGQFDPRCPACGAVLEARPVTEEHPVDPRNVYAATKLHQEHLVAAFVREHDATAVALRYHNVYGPRMPRDTPYAGVAAIFAGAFLRGDAPQVFEDGLQRRDFVHVRDVARANLLALTADTAPWAVLNIASGEARCVFEMAEAIRVAFGRSAPRPEVTGGWRAGDVRHIVSSPCRASRELGFRASVSFDHGMAELARELASASSPRAT
jgi:dTDP-L-rhamnose 4-epimerase